jgi:hypothetical protein
VFYITQCSTRTPAHVKLRLHNYYEKRLRTDAVQGYWSEDAIKDYGEFLYIYWPVTAGTCIKIPSAKNYKQ